MSEPQRPAKRSSFRAKFGNTKLSAKPFTLSGVEGQSILANTLIAAGGRLFNVALGIVIIGLITRFLGVIGYGSYVLLLAYGSILQTVADFGLYLTLTRAISQHPHQENYYLAHISSLRLVLLLIVFAAGGVIMLAFPSLRSLLPLYGIAAVGFAAQSLSQLMVGVYQKYGTVWRATIGDTAARLVQLAGIMMIGAARASLTSMITLFTLSVALAAYLHRRMLPSSVIIKPAFAWSIWRRILTTSWPLGALLILNVVYFRIDTIMLSLLRSPAEVGFYGLAYRLIEATLFLPAMFGGLLLPRLSYAWQHNQAQLKTYLQQGMMVVFWAAALIVMVLFFFAKPIIILVAGHQFLAAAIPFSILTFALAAMFVGNLAGFSLVACHRQKALLILAGSLVIFNVFGNLILIPIWGAPGAAFTTVATEIIAALSATIMIQRQVRFVLPITFLVHLTLLSLLTVLVLNILPPAWPVLINIGITAGIYITLSMSTQIINRSKLSLLLTPAPQTNGHL